MADSSINRAAERTAIGLAGFALFLVIIGVTLWAIRPPQPPPQDEGALARLFQLSVALLVPTLIAFVATADWRHPWRNARTLAFTFVTLAIAFGLLRFAELN
jgi:hypothetical protein